jgi:hypothetical protein
MPGVILAVTWLLGKPRKMLHNARTSFRALLFEVTCSIGYEQACSLEKQRAYSCMF